MRSLWIVIFIVLVLLPKTVNATPGSTIDTGPLQLADKYSPEIAVNEYYISEKLDGIRARWTGSQLITRNGNKIHAPAWFTRGWPSQPLDGELWTRPGDFERIASIVLSHTPDARWQEIKMMVFDTPVTNVPFRERLAQLHQLISLTDNPTLVLIRQFRLCCKDALEHKIDAVTAAGGEGVMLHHQHALYEDGRSTNLLKAKRHEDDEARVIAHLPGHGKFAGMMGSMLVELRNGKQFKLGTGFTDQQRLTPPPVGSWVTFKYYGFTQRGLPRFASFMRARPDRDIKN